MTWLSVNQVAIRVIGLGRPKSEDLKSEDCILSKDCIPSTFLPALLMTKNTKTSEEMSYGESVMETLENGYVIPFSSLPPVRKNPTTSQPFETQNSS